jgi:hypothetical protein
MPWPPSYRLPLYGILNLAFICYVTAAASIGGSANPRVLYLILLFGLCSSPLLLMNRPNDRFSLYTIFLGMYFVSYGVLDLASLLQSASTEPGHQGLTPGELVILFGGAAFAAGYRAMAARRFEPALAADWPMSRLVIVGMGLWLVGTYASWYWTVRLTVRSGEFDSSSGTGVATLLMLGRYAQPLGLMIMAYAYTMFRSALLTLVIVALAAFQVVLGFASDSKGNAMSAGIMVIVTGFLVHGKIPKSWAMAGVLFIFLAFPIFQAHRAIVVGERGESNANTAANLGKALELSIAGEKRTEAGHAESFFQRSSVKSAIDMIVTKTGEGGVPYEHGYTLMPLIAAFIPRLIWPDKLDVQTGQLVDKVFHVTGTGEVYISPSHLGELYWNFGVAGALIGMLLLGLLLGWINGVCDMSTGASVTRLLILATTIYQTAVRFEGSVAAEYAVWIRSIVGILILHRLFARRGALAGVAVAPVFNGQGVSPALPKFPNLLR